MLKWKVKNIKLWHVVAVLFLVVTGFYVAVSIRTWMRLSELKGRADSFVVEVSDLLEGGDLSELRSKISDFSKWGSCEIPKPFLWQSDIVLSLKDDIVACEERMVIAQKWYGVSDKVSNFLDTDARISEVIKSVTDLMSGENSTNYAEISKKWQEISIENGGSSDFEEGVAEKSEGISRLFSALVEADEAKDFEKFKTTKADLEKKMLELSNFYNNQTDELDKILAEVKEAE